MKKLSQAPLPFQGQKRNFVKQFREVIASLDDSYTYIDLFGGSGLLAANIKDIHPNARVVYNDYDNYIGRCQKVAETNHILREMRIILGGGRKNHARLSKGTKAKIARLVHQHPDCDYITLAVNLLFSAKLPSSKDYFLKQSWYNNMRLTDYDETTALNFHLGLDVISQTYTEVIASFNKQSRVIYIIDPPYPSTDISTYGKTSPLSFKEHLDVASLMHTHNAIYFTSNKGNLVEFHDWLIDNNHRGVFSPTAKIHTRINHLSKYVRYRDYMIVDITR